MAVPDISAMSLDSSSAPQSSAPASFRHSEWFQRWYFRLWAKQMSLFVENDVDTGGICFYAGITKSMNLILEIWKKRTKRGYDACLICPKFLHIAFHSVLWDSGRLSSQDNFSLHSCWRKIFDFVITANQYE